MSENKKPEAGKIKKTQKINLKISSLDTDKREYQEIVLSNSNIPDRDYKPE